MDIIKLVKELEGKHGSIRVGEGFDVNVRVTGLKLAYGNVRLQVVPLSGMGDAWVELYRFTPAKP